MTTYAPILPRTARLILSLTGAPGVAFAITSGLALGQQSPLFAALDSDFTPLDGAGLGIEVGDVDGDGDLDVIKGDFGQLVLLLNRGDGSYVKSATPLPAASGGWQIPAFGDVDGDGDLDVYVGAESDQSPSDRLWLNNGAGVFTDASTQLPPALGWTRCVSFTDLDADGDIDVFTGLHSTPGFLQPSARLLLNDGTGHFVDASAQLPPLLAGTTTFSVAAGDLDGDGDVDLLLGRGQEGDGVLSGTFPSPDPAQARFLRNDGAGTFSEATLQLPQDPRFTRSIALGDVDGDGDLDAVMGNEPPSDVPQRQDQLWLNDGAGHFTDASMRLPYDGDETLQFSLADLDGDGDLDLVRGGNWWELYDPTLGTRRPLWLNDGGGTFSGAPIPQDFSGAATGIEPADVDGDGDIDLITGLNSKARIWLNDGAAGFVDATGRAEWKPGASGDVAIGDVDGDGDADALFGDRLLRNGGVGWFSSESTTLPISRAPSSAIELADLDGDGDLDAVVGREGRNELWLNDGSGTYQSTIFGVPAYVATTTSIAVVDVDSDGDLDIVVGNHGAQNELWMNDGAANFTDASAQLPQVIDPTRKVILADLDGDTDLDVVFGNDSLEANVIAMNNGSGVFVAKPGALPPTQHNTLTIAAGDVDGDGDLDLTFGGGKRGFSQIGSFWELGSPASPPELWLNDGTGQFAQAAGPFLEPIPVAAMALEDVDHNGTLDIVLAQPIGYHFGPVQINLQQVHVWLGDGSGGFQNATALLADQGPRAWGFAVHDIDEDGDVDIFSSHGIQRNLTRHLTHRRFPRIGQPLDMDINGSPGSTWVLASSLGTVRRPLGSLGILRLDGSTFSRRGMGSLDAAGRATATFNVPATPSLVGTTVYWQALLLDPMALTNLESSQFSGH